MRVPASEPKTVKNRIHLDLKSDSAEEQSQVVGRLRELGAEPVYPVGDRAVPWTVLTDPDIGQGDVSWVVLADPEGNEFCVLPPR